MMLHVRMTAMHCDRRRPDEARGAFGSEGAAAGPGEQTRADTAATDTPAQATAIRTEDIVKVLTDLGLIKYWKGDHIISVTARVVEEHLRALERKQPMGIDASRLHWTPYIPPNAAGKK